ncbi:MAG: hypothetical protein AAF639_41595, partial [Chloroflexota bacterium]
MRKATITKSIRLSDMEANELGILSKQTALSEAALMKKWVLEGIRIEKLERAIQSYMKGTVDLRSGAIMAGVSYNHFMYEVESRNIVRFEGMTGRLSARAGVVIPFRMIGRVRKVVGTIIHAIAPDVQVGELVNLFTRETGHQLAAEVVGFSGPEALLSPIGDTLGVSPNTEVYPTGHVQ